MTDKEHLEGVKNLIDKYENCYAKEIALKYASDLMRYHARYFVKQAERVQELEETVEDYKAVNKELHQRGRKVRKQNKCYREELDILREVINSAPNADKLNEEYERLKGLEGEE